MATIYVETSVWSHAFAEDAPEKREETLRFLDRARAGVHELFISPVVFEEVSQAEEERANKILALIRDTAPRVLDLGQEAQRLARRFLEDGALPPSKADDARHVAVATIEELDILVSWNYKHLVNVRRREAITRVAALCGYYKPLHIVTPPEVNYASE
jgi:predicted nucleic acid-binding protein